MEIHHSNEHGNMAETSLHRDISSRVCDIIYTLEGMLWMIVEILITHVPYYVLCFASFDNLETKEILSEKNCASNKHILELFLSHFRPRRRSTGRKSRKALAKVKAATSLEAQGTKLSSPEISRNHRLISFCLILWVMVHCRLICWTDLSAVIPFANVI